MKITMPILLLIFLFGAQQVVAHSDHGHDPVSDAVAMSLASEVSINLSSRDVGLGFGQLAKSWASIPKKNIAIYKKDSAYYIVSVLNESEKKTLYVLMSNSGEV
jgi:hypothetical protein